MNRQKFDAANILKSSRTITNLGIVRNNSLSRPGINTKLASAKKGINAPISSIGIANSLDNGSGFNYNFSTIPVKQSTIPTIQAKLTIGQPNDKYEQEADRVADQVMRMPMPLQSSSLGENNSTISSSGTIQRVCATCSDEYKTAENENRTVEPTNLCPRCRIEEKGLIQTKQIAPLIQAKIAGNVTPTVTPSIGQPNDKYEQEADRVAEEFVRLPGAIGREGRLQRACVYGRGEEVETLQGFPIKLPHISSLNQPTVARLRLSDLIRSEPLQIPDEEIFPEEDGVIQNKSAPGPGLKGSTDVGSAVVPTDLKSTILRRCESSGEPLSVLTRAFLEPRFGQDFSRVRVHTNRPSAEIARQLNARAFTLGNHIFFSPGEYHLQHRSGRKLLAHELTHVVQQGATGSPALSTRIQRSEDHSLALCPPYWRWETPRDAETFNCAGLAHRTYDFKSLAAARTALSTGRTIGCGSPCNSGEVKHWMWEFDTHVEDHTGRRLTRTSHDFHTVSGVAFGDPVPQDPTDVYSTDGRRPVHGPATGYSFRPLAREQAKMNDASERLQKDAAGNPVFWILYNYRTSCHCLPCPP